MDRKQNVMKTSFLIITRWNKLPSKNLMERKDSSEVHKN